MKQITEEQIKEAAEDNALHCAVVRSSSKGDLSFGEWNRKNFKAGARWMQEQQKTAFLDFIQSTELSQKDKDLVKGVFYGWLSNS